MRPVSVAVVTTALSLLIAVSAVADQQVVIEHVSFDEQTMELTLHADVVDTRGIPMEGLKDEAFEFQASGKPLKFTEIEIQTSQEASEPIAVCILMNASNAYQIASSDELHSTFDQQKQGVTEFIKRLKGNDKVAVVLYRENVPHEIVYDFASNFKQAMEAATAAKVPDADFDPETIGGAQAKKRSLAPEVLRAVQKSLGYMVDKMGDFGSARRRFLIVMSDGKDRETRKSRLTSKVDRILEKYEEFKIRIHAIGYTADDPQYLSILQGLSNGSGGLYQRIDTKDFAQIPAVWDGLAQRIKKQYILKLKLEELPDHGEPIKGKDLANYVIQLNVKTKDGAVLEAQYNDVVLPQRSFDWMGVLKIVGMVIGGIIGLVVLIVVIKLIAGRKGSEPEVQYVEQAYDGPDRGKLKVLKGPLAGEIFPLIDDVTTIGSMKGNTIVIQDGSVSRRHAAIKIDQMRYEVADMNSTNGVLVNGARIHKVFLRDGDTITIGSTEIEFRLK